MHGDSSSEAFRRLAKYIGVFGTPENGGSSAIAMTAPVVNSGMPIAMTAPVTNADGKMAFILPARFQSVADAPSPTNPLVSLRQIESRVMAALTFSGSANEDSVHRKLKELQALLSEKGIAMKDGAAPKYEVARYNPPWTLPFLRTNEVLIPVPESAVPSADAIEETK